MLHLFASADLADEIQIAADVATVQISTVAFVAMGGDGAAEQLGEQDFGERFHDCVGRRGEGVGDEDLEDAFVQLDFGAGVGVAPEFHVDERNGRAGTHLAEDTGIDFLGGERGRFGNEYARVLDLHSSRM